MSDLRRGGTYVPDVGRAALLTRLCLLGDGIPYFRRIYETAEDLAARVKIWETVYPDAGGSHPEYMLKDFPDRELERVRMQIRPPADFAGR